MVKKPVIFFLGKSGCGKDTQAEILIKERGFEMINSGAILRAFRDAVPQFKKGSLEQYEGLGVKNIIDAGLFVPTLTIVCQWRLPLLDIVRSPKKTNGIVFTGSPRKLAEAILLHEFFINWPDAKKYFRIYPIEMRLTDKEMFRRLSLRRQCAKCKKIFSGMKEDLELNICSKCGGKLMHRADDNPQGIRSRLKEYNEYVVPVLNYFKKEKLLKSVNGGQGIQKVHQDIVRATGL